MQGAIPGGYTASVGRWHHAVNAKTGHPPVDRERHEKTHRL